MIPTKAFILAAGLGTRMRPLTDNIPKPLAMVAGRSLLERTLDGLRAAGVTKTVINTHHLGDKIIEQLKHYEGMELVFSHEPVLLDTGGGIKNTLQHFGQEPFYVLSGDGLWSDAPGLPALQQMAQQWDAAKMDILILLQPVATMKLTKGVGDYDILPDDHAVRSKSQTGTHMFTSMRINHPRIFAGATEGVFSYLTLLDRAEHAGRLYAIEHRGEWHHISTEADLQAVNSAFLASNGAA